MEIKEYISKSDFMVAMDCPAKLYYKKLKYPSNLEENEYMKFLAEGGYSVGKLATLLKPGGIEVGREHGFDLAVEETAELLKKENVTIYEAGIYSNHKLVFIDILEKKGNVLNLIEVKSKSTDSSDPKPDPKMKKYYEDVAFQAMVLKKAYPGFEVHSFLFLPDKAKRTQIEGLAGWFRIECEYPDETDPGKKRIKADFVHPSGSKEHQLLLKDDIMTLVNVDAKVAALMPGIESEATKFVESIKGGVKKLEKKINTDCFKCEYRASKEKPQDGYRECWKELADVSPHISELYFAGTVGGKEQTVDKLIAQGRVCLYDLSIEALKKSDGKMGPRGDRQKLQILKTRENAEWFSDDMKEKLDSWEYPLWFIDFETSTNALPFHKGMRPYELVAFQWSCHKLDKNGTLTHDEWINLDPGFPNFRFAESLMAHISDKGTPLMWATHENTVLRKVLEQMDVFGYKNDKLRGWLERITKDDKKNRPGRLVDMCRFTMDNYFHPDMKKSTSLKMVLPAVWMNHAYLWENPWFKEDYVKFKDGKILNPYDTLAGDVEESDDDQNVVVRDGTGAMRAYYDMVFGEYSKDPAARAVWRDKLLHYCKLDTMSMVIVWKHWIKM